MTRVFCKDCVYWDEMSRATATKNKEGRCRRHAPTPTSEDAMTDTGTIWPSTFDDDWCGEGVHINELAQQIQLDELYPIGDEES